MPATSLLPSLDDEMLMYFRVGELASTDQLAPESVDLYICPSPTAAKSVVPSFETVISAHPRALSLFDQVEPPSVETYIARFDATAAMVLPSSEIAIPFQFPLARAVQVLPPSVEV